MDFSGRTVLITGGSRGLGLLIARELGRLGARVVLVARDAQALASAREELTERGVDASTIVADISSEAEATRIVSETVDCHGRLDVLVNNAGVIKVGPLEHMTVGDFEEAMATHFWGPLHAMRAAVPHMRRAGGGRIVNISIGGRQDRGSASRPVLREQVRAGWSLDGLSVGAFPTWHPRDHGEPRPDAHRLAVQRVV